MKPLHESKDIPQGDGCSPEGFDRRIYRTRFLTRISEGLADAEAGRVVSDEVLSQMLDAELGKLEP
jgi:hypothetical protein